MTTTTPTETLSTDCVECGLHFDPDPAEAKAYREAQGELREGEISIEERVLRYCLRSNDWMPFRGTDPTGDYLEFKPTCPACVAELETTTLATMPHPAWGCEDCYADLEQGVAVHSRTWRVSDVPTITLMSHGHNAPGAPTDYYLSMVDLWDDLSADEALRMAGVLLEICQLLDEHDLRDSLNNQVEARLARQRAFEQARA